MRFYIELEGREVKTNETNQYSLEVHADHAQEAKTIALVKARVAGLDVDAASIKVSSEG